MSRSDPVLKNAAVLALAIMLIYLGLWQYLKDDPRQSLILSDLGAVLVNGLASLSLLFAALFSCRMEKKLCKGWILLFLSGAAFFLGDVLFAYYDMLLGVSASPTVADVFYILSYPFFFSGVLMLPSADFKTSERAKLLLDIGIVLISSVLIYWSFFIAPAIEQNLGSDRTIMFLAVAYPIGDLIQLFALVELLFRRHRNPGLDPLLFLGIYCAANIFADAVYMRQSMSGIYVSGGALDAIWIFSYLMFGLAGVAHMDELRSGRFFAGLRVDHHYGEVMWPLYLPYICASIAFLMLVYSFHNPLAIPFSIISLSVGGIIGLVIARQVLVLRENAALYREAQEEIRERREMQKQVICLNLELEKRVTERTSQLEGANRDLQRQILERQIAEEALRDSERRLSDIIDFLPDATFVINRNGVVIAWNRAIEKMTGIKASTILYSGDLVYSLPFYGEKRPVLADVVLQPQLSECLKYDSIKWQEEDLVMGEFFVSSLLGRSAYLLASATVLYDSEGEVYGAIETIRDITDHKMIEEDLKRERDRAESATIAKSRFLANMSHEIRTPMNAVIGMSDLLLQMELKLEQRDYLEIIKNSGNALLAIINDILDYSKIDGDKLSLEFMPFDLRGCVEVSMDLVAAKAAEKGLVLTYFVDDAVPASVIGDENRLRQILINLLGNAVKFTEMGEVMLTVKASPVPVQEPRSGPGLNWPVRLVFSVRDTGIGISEENLGKLFQSFSQVETSTTRFYGGTGLGLAISRRLVEMMNGEIEVQSSLGVGSTFSFTIQCDAAGMKDEQIGAGQMKEGGASGPALEGRSALIVSESESVRVMLIHEMRPWSMRVTGAGSREEALHALLREPFDFLILDGQMRQSDAEHLKRDASELFFRPKLIVIDNIGARTRIEPNVMGRLIKPVKARQLLRILNGLLVPNSSSAEAEAVRQGCAPLQASKKLSILLVEDNPVNQKVALSMLKRLGRSADVANNGIEALQSMQNKTYDLILMDIQMPDMDGLDATRRIRSDWTERVPYIIAMTAYALDGDREEFLKAGMNDYLSKPIRIEELRAALETAERMAFEAK